MILIQYQILGFNEQHPLGYLQSWGQRFVCCAFPVGKLKAEPRALFISSSAEKNRKLPRVPAAWMALRGCVLEAPRSDAAS